MNTIFCNIAGRHYSTNGTSLDGVNYAHRIINISPIARTVSDTNGGMITSTFTIQLSDNDRELSSLPPTELYEHPVKLIALSKTEGSLPITMVTGKITAIAYSGTSIVFSVSDGWEDLNSSAIKNVGLLSAVGPLRLINDFFVVALEKYNVLDLDMLAKSMQTVLSIPAWSKTTRYVFDVEENVGSILGSFLKQHSLVAFFTGDGKLAIRHRALTGQAIKQTFDAETSFHDGLKLNHTLDDMVTSVTAKHVYDPDDKTFLYTYNATNELIEQNVGVSRHENIDFTWLQVDLSAEAEGVDVVVSQLVERITQLGAPLLKASFTVSFDKINFGPMDTISITSKTGPGYARFSETLWVSSITYDLMKWTAEVECFTFVDTVVGVSKLIAPTS